MVKVSPDEHAEEQITSICAAVWKSGVDGVVVGNTTTSRPEGTCLSETEATVMEERGGYSGPQVFHRTVSLVKKYRQILDYPLQEQNKSQQTQLQPPEAISRGIEASFKRGERNLEDASDGSIDQLLIGVPKRHSSSTTGGTKSDTATTPSSSQHLEQSSTSKPPAQPVTLTPKIIFCTGGITNGQQALEVLSAGAFGGSDIHRYDLAKYSGANLLTISTTALVYGGVGKITSMKQEMRHKIQTSLQSDVRRS